MKGDVDSLLERFGQCIGLLELSAKYFLESSTAQDQRYHWSSVIKHCHNSFASLVSAAGSTAESKGLAYRVKNQQTEDPHLNYLFRCRNAEDHPEDYRNNAGARISSQMVSVHGAVALGGKNNQLLNNLFIMPDGTEITIHGTVDIRSGVVKAKFSDDRVILREIPRYFVLSEVLDNNGKRWPVPREGNSDFDIAAKCIVMAVSVLKMYRSELNDILVSAGRLDL